VLAGTSFVAVERELLVGENLAPVVQVAESPNVTFAGRRPDYLGTANPVHASIVLVNHAGIAFVYPVHVIAPLWVPPNNALQPMPLRVTAELDC